MRAAPTILHLDMDAFFAAVEQAAKPSLRGKPVVVGGLGPRGVVATASYEARRFGLRSAMPTAQARRLAPNAAYLVPRFSVYREVSGQVMELLGELSPLVEPLSLDEAFVDLEAGGTAFDAEGARATGERLRRDILAVTGLTGSVGLAGSKMLAKIASEQAKPDGLVLIEPGTERELLAPMGVRTLPGVGPATAEQLRRAGVTTVAELAEAGEDELVRLLGRAHGTSLYAMALGYDDRPVVAERDAKSVSVEDTFDVDLHDRARVRWEVERLAERCVRRLREAGRSGRTVVLKVRRYDFSTLTRSETLRGPTDDQGVVREAAARLLDLVDTTGGVRLLGVGVSGLADYTQEDLFAQAAAEGLDVGAAEDGGTPVGADAGAAGADEVDAAAVPGVTGPGVGGRHMAAEAMGAAGEHGTATGPGRPGEGTRGASASAGSPGQGQGGPGPAGAVFGRRAGVTGEAGVRGTGPRGGVPEDSGTAVGLGRSASGGGVPAAEGGFVGVPGSGEGAAGRPEAGQGAAGVVGGGASETVTAPDAGEAVAGDAGAVGEAPGGGRQGGPGTPGRAGDHEGDAPAVGGGPGGATEQPGAAGAGAGHPGVRVEAVDGGSAGAAGPDGPGAGAVGGAGVREAAGTVWAGAAVGGGGQASAAPAGAAGPAEGVTGRSGAAFGRGETGGGPEAAGRGGAENVAGTEGTVRAGGPGGVPGRAAAVDGGDPEAAGAVGAGGGGAEEEPAAVGARDLTARRWAPGQDVRHAEHGAGWVQGSGVGRVTVRFEEPGSPPGRARTFRTGDPALEPSDPLPLVPGGGQPSPSEREPKSLSGGEGAAGPGRSRP
ncbi:DNA polymerase IV [Streptomyces sp. MUM 203J]|uniref:DNA polymerase IV n=1 Tax=Streptomyces sp. MUM 203J TaxID=2791990 RepID=UPI001F043458|nr:DNA polymerase IV [Streptomyces sp. MUM 203J]